MRTRRWTSAAAVLGAAGMLGAVSFGTACDSVLGIQELDATFPDGSAETGPDTSPGFDRTPPPFDAGSDVDAAGEAGCSNACDSGATTCGLAEIQTCKVGSNGCTDWVPTTTCEAGLICDRSGNANCTYPEWAEWKMPNGPIDVEAGAPFLQAYTMDTSGTVTDNVTQLIWQQTAMALKNRSDAAAYCSALTVGGFNDWRVPSLIELVSIVDFSVANPPIDPLFFPSTEVQHYWTSSPLAVAGDVDSGQGWDVSFTFGGFVGNNAYGEELYVRCVR